MPSLPSKRRPTVNSSAVLFAGFGGLLVLMAFAQVEGIRALRRIQEINDRVREEFLLRTRVLERIRGDLYLSGTYIRDYLLEPDPGAAEGHRYSLIETRRDMDEALQEYQRLLNGPDARPFGILVRSLAAYWDVLQPVFSWSPRQRQAEGWKFLQRDVFPRRTAMLGIADQIASVNTAQLNQGKATVNATSTSFRRALSLTIGLTIGLGIALASFSIWKILALERQAALRYSEIAQARTELKQLSARLVDAQETERRSIARELHDEVGQELTGILVEMANLSTSLRAGDHANASARADEIKRMVEESIRVVRDMALLLRPSMLDDLGLIPALEWQARETSKRTAIRVKVDAENVPDDLPEETKTCLYRVVQEGLHNCVQHSGARHAVVTAQVKGERLELAIRDDGKGFDPAKSRGMGLLGIQERVGHLGGTLSIGSSGSGTELRVEIPLGRLASGPPV